MESRFMTNDGGRKMSYGFRVIRSPLASSPRRRGPILHVREVGGYGFPLPAFAGTGFAGTTPSELHYSPGFRITPSSVLRHLSSAVPCSHPGARFLDEPVVEGLGQIDLGGFQFLIELDQ